MVLLPCCVKDHFQAIRLTLKEPALIPIVNTERGGWISVGLFLLLLTFTRTLVSSTYLFKINLFTTTHNLNKRYIQNEVCTINYNLQLCTSNYSLQSIHYQLTFIHDIHYISFIIWSLTFISNKPWKASTTRTQDFYVETQWLGRKPWKLH